MKLSVLLAILGWASVFVLTWLTIVAPQVLVGPIPIFVPWVFFLGVAILAMGSMEAEKQKQRKDIEKAMVSMANILAGESKDKERTPSPRNQN